MKDFWEEGRYLDLWSVVHLISGVFLGIILSFLNISFLIAFVIAVILTVLGEVVEIVLNVGESWQNQITDIIVGLIGFVITYMMYPLLAKPLDVVVPVVLLPIYIMLNFLGWRAYRRRQNRTKA